MYAIGHIIYGIPLSESASRQIEIWESDPESEQWYEDEDGCCGFRILYNGAGRYQDGYCGVELGQINGFGIQDVATLNLSPTSSQKRRAIQRIARVPRALQDLCPRPGVFIVWGSS